MNPIEVAAIPRGILDYLSNTNKNFPRKPNHYWVTDICKCLRQSYYQITGTPVDSNAEPDIERLWVLQSRKFLHNLTYAYKWRELDIEKEVQLDDGVNVTLHARLDMYDCKNGNIIDLKTTSAVKWQQEKGLIPRGNDIDQLQCYGTLFLDLVTVSELTLLYADMKNLIAFRIPFVDRAFWIKAQLARLHNALETSTTPVAEPSKLCDICAFKDRCHKE
jgi:hypothetical protein